MTEPSYYPLTSLHPPREDAASTTPGVPEHDSEPQCTSNTITAEDPPIPLSNNHPTPIRSRSRNNSLPAHPLVQRIIRTPLKLALLPLIAIAYLAFCYTVRDKAVPVDTYGLYGVTPQHLSAVKGGITSISIIIISIALFPVYSVISDLQTEEFFRVLASRSHGVPLETINNISTPSFGNIDKIMAMWNFMCSGYYMLGIFASILVWIVATLAPGALTIDSVLADGGLVAIEIAAVPPQSVLNGSQPTGPNEAASLNSDTAASVTWAEMQLGVQTSFGVANTSQPDYAAYIVPVPLNLSTATSARWLSDIIGINPTCSWASTNLTTAQAPPNLTSATSPVTAYLPDFDLDIELTSISMISPINGLLVTIVDPSYSIKNHTTQAPASSGSTVFLLAQCVTGCLPSLPVDVSVDMSGINTTFMVAVMNLTSTVAILTCIPNITIETREVRSDGYGMLSVQPLPGGRALTSQGNLNPIQTTAMFSIVTMGITENGGALSENLADLSSFGSQVQGDVLFGKAQFNALPGINAPWNTTVIISPASIEEITAGYTQMIQSASKAYLSGYLGSAYVPGRISAPEIVFATSMPNVIVSTVVFALLIVVIIVTHFRSGKGAKFTLVNVVAAVHESELPALFAQGGGAHVHADGEGDVQRDEDVLDVDEAGHSVVHALDEHPDIVEALRDKRIFTQKRADGSAVLHISSE